jgi:hypothetical protein
MKNNTAFLEAKEARDRIYDTQYWQYSTIKINV